MRILALNSGSNSLKFQVIRIEPLALTENSLPETPEVLVSGSYDNIGKEGGVFTLFDETEPAEKKPIDLPSYRRAAEFLCDWFNDGGAKSKGIAGLADLDRVGHRVVHGALAFRSTVLITDPVIESIEELEDLAPLHNASALQVIRAVREKVPRPLPMFAVFDTVFHQTIPDAAALYALPPGLAARHGIRRYGFHGVSHRYLMLRYAQLTGRELARSRLITAHLEGGSSVTAICNGCSVETSMGFTPLEGLVMGTRSGDLDPAIVPYLMRKENLDAKEIEEFLNKKCGLLGLSGVSSDTRELLPKLGDPQVDLAVDIFCHRVRKFLGAYLAILNGADAIVLGGGISENTPYVRERICRNLDSLGICLDCEANKKLVDREGLIATPDSKVSVWVIPTKENLMVAVETARGQLDQN